MFKTTFVFFKGQKSHNTPAIWVMYFCLDNEFWAFRVSLVMVTAPRIWTFVKSADCAGPKITMGKSTYESRILPFLVVVKYFESVIFALFLSFHTHVF